MSPMLRGMRFKRRHLRHLETHRVGVLDPGQLSPTAFTFLRKMVDNRSYLVGRQKLTVMTAMPSLSTAFAFGRLFAILTGSLALPRAIARGWEMRVAGVLPEFFFQFR